MQGLLKRGKGKKEEAAADEEGEGAVEEEPQPKARKQSAAAKAAAANAAAAKGKVTKPERDDGPPPSDEKLTVAPLEAKPEMPEDGQTVCYRGMKITRKDSKMIFRIFAPANVYPKGKNTNNDWTRQYGTAANPATDHRRATAFQASCDLVDDKWKVLNNDDK